MRSTLSGWQVELVQWLKPFLDRLGHMARRRMCPLYVTGFIGPGDLEASLLGQMAATLVAAMKFANRLAHASARNASVNRCAASSDGDHWRSAAGAGSAASEAKSMSANHRLIRARCFQAHGAGRRPARVARAGLRR